MAQSVKRPTLDIGSGHDLTVCGFEPHARLRTDSAEPACDSVCPAFSAPPLLALSLFFSLSLSK